MAMDLIRDGFRGALGDGASLLDLFSGEELMRRVTGIVVNHEDVVDALVLDGFTDSSPTIECVLVVVGWGWCGVL